MNAPAFTRRVNQRAGRVPPALPPQWARTLLARQKQPPVLLEQAAAARARRVSFRFGLSGLRWGNEGPAVLMLHGWQGRPTQFHQLIAPLLATGRQVIALEAPQSGESFDDESSLLELAMALQEAAVEVRNLESVIGHSTGAAAVAIALSQGLDAERAVLIAPPSSLGHQANGFSRRLGLPRVATDRFLRWIGRTEKTNARDSAMSRLAATLRVPALVVHDRSDSSVPFADGHSIAQAWPGAQLISTEGLGHWRVLADPDVVQAVAGFVTSQAAPKMRDNWFDHNFEFVMT